MKQKIFIHNFEIFDTDILVCVGVNAKQIKQWLDKNGSKGIKAGFNDGRVKELQEVMDNSSGFVHKNNYGGLDYYFLWIKNLENQWNTYSLIIHELTHYKQFLFKSKRIKDEVEFEAYFMESCFQSLRKAMVKRKLI